MADPRADTADGLVAALLPPSDAGAPQTPRAALQETPLAAVAATADPRADTADGLAALPPPPPPPQIEASDAGAAETPRAALQETPVATDAAMADPRADTADGLAAALLPPPPPPQTEASGAGAPQTPRAALQETPVAADAAMADPRADTVDGEALVVANAASLQPPAPPLPPLTPPQELRQDDDTGKDGKEIINQRQSRWPRVRSPVLWLLSLFSLRLEKQSQLIDQPKIPPPPPPEEDVPDKAAVEKDQGEGSKHRHEEAPKSASGCIPSLAPGTGSGTADESLDAGLSPMTKKLQNAGRLVKKTLSWYRRHRSTEKPADEAAAQAEKGVETKPPEEETTKPKQDKVEAKEPPHPRWPFEEKRLEKILEDACTRLVGAEFRNLRAKKKMQFLLTSFVFDLGAEVKKQAVTYWWAAQFELSPRDADAIFSALSNDGFLEPIKNRCSDVIHGFRVNPLVHWMVKKEERDCNVADPGDDTGKQVVDRILCLTTDNRDLLQKISKVDELVSQERLKSSPRKNLKASKEPPESGDGPHKSSQDTEMTESKNEESLEAGKSLSKLNEKRIIVNINADVYRLPEALLTHLADRLEVLQLGGWRNSDDDPYMEVDALESLKAIGKLKNLRYLGLRGLSRLTVLPTEVQRLRQLAILDVRGCQNLVKVRSATVKTLNRLTHLDLTECYMLEHIGCGVAALTELQVFKGFVFCVGKRRRNNQCRLQDLAKLRKLRKLSVNVTTDAYVDKGEMQALGKLAALESLTVTWGELPSVLLKGDERLTHLLDRWTNLVLPMELKKLDVRCYPKKVLPEKWFQGRQRLKKLYVRGGVVKQLDIPDDNSIEILRLRYLNKFKMTWDELLAMLNRKTKTIRCVEVVDMDLKVMRNETKQRKDGPPPPPRRRTGKDGKEVKPMKKRMCIPERTLDEDGLWVWDVKEEENGKAPMEDAPKAEAAATGTPADVPKVSGKAEEGDGHGGDDMVKNGVQVKDEKISASSPAPASGGDAKEGAHNSSAPELGKAPEAPGMVPTPKTEGGGTDVPEAAVKSREDDDNASDTDKISSIAEDESSAEEDRGEDTGAVREDVDAGAVGEVAGVAQTGHVVSAEDEGKDVGGGHGAGGEVLDLVEQLPTTWEDGGGGDTSTAAWTISQEALPPKIGEETVSLSSAATKAGAASPQPQALPAATDPAPPAAAGEAAMEPNEPGKAGDDDGSTVARNQVGVNSPGLMKN